MAQRQFKTSDTTGWAERYGNGSAGALTINANTTDATANTTASVASGSTAFTAGSGTGFAADNLILIHQSRNGGVGAGNWELNKIASVGAGTNWTLAYTTMQAYDTTAQVYLLNQYSTVTVNSTKTLTSSAWDGTKGGIVAYLANTSVTIDGSITLKDCGFRGGAGNSASGQATQGEGTAALGTTSTAANGNGGGGGTTGFGGGGGNGVAGSTGDAPGGTTPGTGGSAVGNAALTVAAFGGGAGGGSSGTSGGTGRVGGGFVLIISPVITVHNTTGTVITDGTNAVAAGGRPGGGSAGGSALFKGNVITLNTTRVTAASSTGAGGADNPGSISGGGSVGRIHVDYGSTFTGTTTPTVDSSQDSQLVPSQAAFLLNFI